MSLPVNHVGDAESALTPEGRRLMKAGAIGAGVLAGLGLAAYLIYAIGIAPAAARWDYERATADWVAAGLGEPLVWPQQAAPVSPEFNLLLAPPFDGLGAVEGAVGAAVRWIKVPYWSFAQNRLSGGRFGFDPALPFVGHSGVGNFLPKLTPGQKPERVILETLEKAFPELTRIEAVVAERPGMAVRPMPWDWRMFRESEPAFNHLRANGRALTAYAGCKVIEGDGAPAATLVPVMLRYARVLGGRGRVIDAHCARFMVQDFVPRLTRLALEKGVWNDDQLGRVQAELAHTRFAPAMRTALGNEMRVSLSLAVGYARHDPEATRLWAAWAGGADFGVGCWQEATGWHNAALMLDRERTARPVFDPKAGWDVTAIVAANDAAVLASRSSMADVSTATYTGYSRYTALADCELATAELGCALERFRRKMGTCPEKLAALIPEFIDGIPSGIWKGQTLVYARTPEGGYTLTWPGAHYTDSLGGLSVNETHPGPWDFFGYSVELPKSVTCFDSETIARRIATREDVVWTMPKPKKQNTEH